MHPGGLPPILPGLLVALLASVLLDPFVARRLAIGRPHAWLLLVGLGTILALTLTPSRDALDFGIVGSVGCDLSRIGPAPLWVYTRGDDPILNVLLFIPLGLAIGTLPAARARRWLILGAALLPAAIETAQALVVVLDRACQGGDVFDNVAGLAVGLAVGWLGRLLWQRLGSGSRG